MAKIQTDSEFDRNLEKKKKMLSDLKKDVQSYISTYRSLSVADRAAKYRVVEKTFQNIQSFILGTNVGLINNTGSKYEFQNLRQGFRSILTRWNKFQKDLEKI